MAENSNSFFVNPYQDPVLVIVEGKATFQNSRPVSELFSTLLGQGHRNFVIDFEKCAGMDSTFLGILAGLGLDVSKPQFKGSVVLSRLGKRNLELVKNLGLHRILVIDEGLDPEKQIKRNKFVKLKDSGKVKSELENAQEVLKAHENLIAADSSNESKFQDVIAFLKNQVDDG